MKMQSANMPPASIEAPVFASLLMALAIFTLI